MKHVIITGGAGFIGSHLCDHFLSNGYAVTAVDNLVTGRRENLQSAFQNQHFELVEKNVSETWEENAFPLLKRFGLEGLLHFACPASPIDFEKIPFDILAVDSVGTANSVDLALKYDARYLLASTSEIYGDPLVHPQEESYWGNVNTIGPRACYDEAKRFGEAYVSSAIRGVGTYRGKPFKPLNGGMVRIFNTYGPRMRPDDGRVVPELCMQALKGEALTIHGEGAQTRSFCFVDDLVDGIVRLYQSSVHEPVNIGNPSERKIMEFAHAVLELTGNRSEIKHLPGREDDPKQRCPNISRAQKQLGWEPQIDLMEGLDRTIEYFRQFL